MKPAIPTQQAPAAQGFAHLRSGRLRDAEVAFRTLLRTSPLDAQALMGLGLVAHQIGRFDDALDCFDRAIRVAPQLAALHVNRGTALAALGRFDEACSAFERALALQPELPSALVNLSSASHARGRLDDAVAILERARAAAPAAADILNNLGNLYKDQGRIADALNAYKEALAIFPMQPVVFSNCLALNKLDTRIGANALRDAHQSWSRWFSHSGSEAPLLQNVPNPDRRLKIGYVSPDAHSALPAFVDPVVAAHDRTLFEIFVYFNHPQPATRIAGMGAQTTVRVMRGHDDASIAGQIHADGIDLLIDIAGHTGHNRLGVFARRPAPVQLTWLDYLCTTGVAGMDYRITDTAADPPGHEEFHSEKLLRLPGTQWCWTPPSNAPPVADSPVRANGFVTFGSFNHAQKLTDATLALWREVMRAIPDARLLVAGLPEGFASERVRRALDLDAGRLELIPRMPPHEYRATFGRVDIVLDPLPFSGATTTLDALYQGVPVLTLPGERSCSRSSASLLVALGLTDWIAANEADFVARALRAAAAPDAFAALRATLRPRLKESVLCDVPRFARNLESAYRSAWRTWCESRETSANRDRELMRTRELLEMEELDEALATAAALCRRETNWELAKVELARAALAWGAAHPGSKAAWQLPFERSPRVRVSVIACSIRPDYFSSLQAGLAAQFAAHDLELIGIHDAKSLCEGFNRGAARAMGDVLIFCHDDISFVHADFGERVLAHLREADVVGLAGATQLVSGDWRHAGAPHLVGQILHRPPPGQEGFLYYAVGLHEADATVRAIDGVWMAMHRRVWETLRFDETAFDGFHLYDADFSYRAALAGFRITVPRDLLLLHYSTGNYDARWQHFHRRFLAKFPELPGEPAARRHGAIHVKLPTLEHVDRVHAALLHAQFGCLEIPDIAIS